MTSMVPNESYESLKKKAELYYREIEVARKATEITSSLFIEQFKKREENLQSRF